MTGRTSLARWPPIAAVAVALASAAGLTGCAAGTRGSPGATVSGVACPTSGPLRASELTTLVVCDLPPGTEISIDVWPGTTRSAGTGTRAADGLPGGAVQNIGECAASVEGVPVTVCTFAAPVGTAGFAGDGVTRVWFGGPEGVARVKGSAG